MRVDPEHAADTARGREATQRAERDGVVAAQHERDRVVAECRDDPRGDQLAGPLDLRQVARPLVLELGRLRDGCRDVAGVAHA